MITGKQLDTIFKQNNITPEDIILYNSKIDEDAFDYNDYEKDEDGYVSGGAYVKNEEYAYDSWLETLCTDEDFIDLLKSMNITEDEVDNGEVDFEDSAIINKAFDIVLEDALDEYIDELEDSMAYTSDPYAYYGVSRSDFL